MAEEYEVKMQKAVEATEREFAKIRTSVATPAILNNVMVDYYGTPTPIPQVAKVSIPEGLSFFQQLSQMRNREQAVRTALDTVS